MLSRPFLKGGKVPEKVKLDGNIGLHGIDAVRVTAERRFAATRLFPEIHGNTPIDILIVRRTPEKVGMFVADTLHDAMQAHTLASAGQQNLHDITMIVVIHDTKISIFHEQTIFLPKSFC